MALQNIIRLLNMTRITPETEYRDLQADLHKAMKAYEDYDVDPTDPDSLSEHRRLWDGAMKANEALLAAAAAGVRLGV
jgi:hypothetical protein